MEQFTYSKCKVANLLRFAHFGMKIDGGAHLLSCSHLVDHTSIYSAHSPSESNWSKLLSGDKHGIPLCIASFNCYNLKIQRVIKAYSFGQNGSSPMFQDLMGSQGLMLNTSCM